MVWRSRNLCSSLRRSLHPHLQPLPLEGTRKTKEEIEAEEDEDEEIEAEEDEDEEIEAEEDEDEEIEAEEDEDEEIEAEEEEAPATPVSPSQQRIRRKPMSEIDLFEQLVNVCRKTLRQDPRETS